MQPTRTRANYSNKQINSFYAKKYIRRCYEVLIVSYSQVQLKFAIFKSFYKKFILQKFDVEKQIKRCHEHASDGEDKVSPLPDAVQFGIGLSFLFLFLFLFFFFFFKKIYLFKCHIPWAAAVKRFIVLIFWGRHFYLIVFRESEDMAFSHGLLVQMLSNSKVYWAFHTGLVLHFKPSSSSCMHEKQ